MRLVTERVRTGDGTEPHVGERLRTAADDLAGRS